MAVYQSLLTRLRESVKRRFDSYRYSLDLDNVPSIAGNRSTLQGNCYVSPSPESDSSNYAALLLPPDTNSAYPYFGIDNSKRTVLSSAPNTNSADPCFESDSS